MPVLFKSTVTTPNKNKHILAFQKIREIIKYLDGDSRFRVVWIYSENL